MKSIKEIWYRKQIAAHEKRVEEAHVGFDNGYKYSEDKLRECQKMRRIFEKFPVLGEASTTKARNAFDESRGWLIMAKGRYEDAQREYRVFRERVGLDVKK